MQHPFQRLRSRESRDSGKSDLLVLAAGSTLILYDLTKKVVTSQWPQEAFSEVPAELSAGDEAKKSIKPGNIGVLEIAPDGDHIVAVSAEDKCIRVFQIDENGTLTLLSERVMPKRPIAIAFPSDEKVMLAGDKFGDVYCLPLHPSPSDVQEESPAVLARPYKPAATDKTVHTVANLRTLEAQLKARREVTEKTGPAFKHSVLLGHVSMLTDLKCAFVHPQEKTSPGDSASSARPYIISADRDEHIRVSRGIPQSHIIEGFCMGHRDFVSRLCLVEGFPHMLISGGGESDLFVWDWVDQKLLHKAPLEPLLAECIKSLQASITAQHGNSDESNKGPDTNSADESDARGLPPVTGIYSLTTNYKEGTDAHVLVTMEALPIILVFSAALKGLSHTQTIICDGNVLDIATSAEGFIVSIDHTHGPGTKILQLTAQAAQLRKFTWKDSQWVLDDTLGDTDGVILPSNSVDVDKAHITELIYNVESLRKQKQLP